MKSFISWLYGAAVSLGGVGVFAVAFLDSSFISLPQINDLLVVLLVVQRKELMPYYAAMATAGSVAGCFVIYRLAAKGGDAFLRRRLKPGHIERGLATYRRHGVLALIVPALLPPPAPFKLFVLLAGVANVRPTKFVASIAAARGFRYLALGYLAVLYGDAALDLMRTHGRTVGLSLAGLLVAGTLALWLWNRRRRS